MERIKVSCAFGDLAGNSLTQLIAETGRDLLGEQVHEQVTDPRLPDALLHRFPLLFKFLDANKTLSVQVHPDDDLAMLYEPPDLGKTEAWYVMDAEPDARIYAGLKPGVDADVLASAAAAGETESVLHSFEPKKGDCVFIPAGTIHAIGEGLLVAEIQQASDTTFRLFDWNRVDDQGNARELHVDEAVHATNYNFGPVGPQKSKPTVDPRCSELIRCSKFTMNHWQSDHEVELQRRTSFRIVAIVDGACKVEGEPSGEMLGVGQTLLLPACLGSVQVVPDGRVEFLEIFVGVN